MLPFVTLLGGVPAIFLAQTVCGQLVDSSLFLVLVRELVLVLLVAPPCCCLLYAG